MIFNGNSKLIKDIWGNLSSVEQEDLKKPMVKLAQQHQDEIEYIWAKLHKASCMLFLQCLRDTFILLFYQSTHLAKQQN